MKDWKLRWNAWYKKIIIWIFTKVKMIMLNKRYISGSFHSVIVYTTFGRQKYNNENFRNSINVAIEWYQGQIQQSVHVVINRVVSVLIQSSRLVVPMCRQHTYIIKLYCVILQIFIYLLLFPTGVRIKYHQ